MLAPDVVQDSSSVQRVSAQAVQSNTGVPIALACRHMRTVLAIGVLAVGVWLGAAGGISYAHDSLAPAAASHNWLPEEEWVTRHWIPFDEQALKAALGLRRRDLQGYLYNDHRALATLAQAR